MVAQFTLPNNRVAQEDSKPSKRKGTAEGHRRVIVWCTRYALLACLMGQLDVTEFGVLLSHGIRNNQCPLGENLGLDFGHVVDQNDPHSAPSVQLKGINNHYSRVEN